MPTSVFLFDGDCSFCSACARFVERYIPHRADVSPWQFADIQRLGLTVQECDAAVQWIGADGRRASGPDAIGLLLRDTPGWTALWWRPMGWLFALPPVRWLSWPVYNWIAAHRDLMPGGTPACAVPQARRAALTGDGDQPPA